MVVWNVVRSEFLAEWERGIAFAEKAGASPGAVRALRAHAFVDVAETVSMLRETADLDPARGEAVLASWRKWFPAYAVDEASRMLPELSVQWPGERARWQQKDQRRKLDRWCSDGEDVLGVLGDLVLDRDQVRQRLRLQRKRFDKLVAALVVVNAVRTLPDGRLCATAGGGYVRQALRARWLGDGSDAPEFVDPLPEGTRKKHMTDSDSLSEFHHRENAAWRKG